MLDLTNSKRLTDEEFKKFAKLIYDECGIFLKETKITLLSNRLRKRLTNLSLDSYTDYYNYIVKKADKKEEIEALIDVVSTNETYFFRNMRHFDALTKSCFQHLAKKKSNKKLKIWSAGCSTGEEPYTISICLLENKHLFPGWTFEIYATDIAFSVLDFAKKGEYSGRRIEKVPPNLLQKYFNQDPERKEIFSVNKDVRSLVRFGTINLFKDKFPTDVDIIFCRNVMIYFDRDHQAKLVKNFYNSLNKDNGYLFIGHSETLHSISDDFMYVKIVDAPVYIPKERKNEF